MMPWKELLPMNLRTEFALHAFEKRIPFDQLCKKYGVSRKTGYKWKKRFIEEGLSGLKDKSRRPGTSPNQVSEEIICNIVKLKLAHPTWGPSKIQTLFANSFSSLDSPSESTVKRILEKAGLVERRRKRASSSTGRISNRCTADHPNHVWTIDFKGWWRTRDRIRFEPLTIRDAFSRYVLCAQALEDSRSDSVRTAMVRVFEKYGLPEIIRSDNGAPFAATNAPLGLSRLSTWWIALGIDLDRIPPARPDQNGAHERMHRDIAREVEVHAASNQVEQQAALDIWRTSYNEERPHEAINMRVPSELYKVSDRKYDGSEIHIEYPSDFLTRIVSKGGNIRLNGSMYTISQSLVGWHIGLKNESSTEYGVWFSTMRLGTLDTTAFKFHATVKRNEVNDQATS